MNWQDVVAGVLMYAPLREAFAYWQRKKGQRMLTEALRSLGVDLEVFRARMDELFKKASKTNGG